VSKRSLMVGSLVTTAIVMLCVGSALATMPGANGRIAFRRYLDAKNTHGAIYTIAPDGSDERQITRPPKGTIDDQPDVSPDGRQIVFHRCPPKNVCRVMIVNADGTGLRTLTKRCPKPPRRDRLPAGCEDGADAYFTPDGTHVTYTRATGRIRAFPKLDTDVIQHSAIAMIRTDGTGRRDIFRLPAYSGDTIKPVVSPAGGRVLFEIATSPIARPRLSHAVYTVGMDGTALRRLTPFALRAGDGPDWSPDGTRVVFRSNEDTGDFLKSQIYTMTARGTDRRRLTQFPSGTRLFSASFSPDGTRIVFGMGRKGSLPDIYTMALDGSDVQRVTRSARWDSAPDWGPAP